MMAMVAPIGALLLGVALLLLGNGLLNTLLAMRSEAESFGGLMLGIIMSSYFVGFFIGTYIAFPIIRRIGHIRTFSIFATLVSSCALLYVVFVNPYAWILLRILNGASLVILHTIIESWLNRQASPESRGTVFAIYMTVNLGSIALAQQLLVIDSEFTFLLFAICSVFISLSLVPIAWTKLKQPEVHDIARIGLSTLYRAAPVAFWGALLSGLVMGAFWGMGALYASRLGLSPSQIASFISLFIIGGALLQLPLGRLSDNNDRRKIVAFITIAAASIALTFIFTPKVPLIIYGFAVIYGGLVFAIYPISVAHLVDHLKPQHMLAGCSSMLLLYGAGAVIGPLLAGQLIQWFGAWSLSAFWAVVPTMLTLIIWKQLRSSEDENPEEYAADFIPMVRTTPSALEMLSQIEQGQPQALDPEPLRDPKDGEKILSSS
ncbi:MAG: MFS family permease [Cellvibrionaceae bacterium]|jgi:MFS family permease